MAVRDLIPEYGLKAMLAVSGMKRSTYFYRLAHLEMPEDELRVRRDIANIFHESSGYYGHRKVAIELGKRGTKMDKKTVARIMKEEGLTCRYRPKKYRHYNEDADSIVPNTLNREFGSDEPMKKMTTDVTEFHLPGAKVYLSPVLDFFNRGILCHQIATAPNAEMVMGMMGKLKDCFRSAGRSLKGTLLHSDQGKLYKAKAYIKFAKENRIERSMSNKGNCYDNCVIECFFGNLKTEIGDLDQFGSVQELVDRIEQYIKYYNEKRIQIGLGGRSPKEYSEYMMRVSAAGQTMKNFAGLAPAAGGAAPIEPMRTTYR